MSKEGKIIILKNATQPCMDVDQHHTSPASELSVGNFALMFQVSVH